MMLVLLSVRLAVGENGIIGRANKANLLNDKATVQEYLAIRAGEGQIEVVSKKVLQIKDYLVNENILSEDGTVNVENLVGSKLKTGNGSNKKDVYVVENGILYYYNGDGTKETVSKVYEEAEIKGDIYPGQKESQDIGIGTDGQAVNLDLWRYVKLADGTYRLNNVTDEEADEAGYIGDFTDGKIKGTVPAYIKEKGDTEFHKVTDMLGTFKNCSELKVAPEIPSSVTNLNYTFYNCTKLSSVTKLPSSVTSVSYTFYNCVELAQTPTIPSKVTSLDNTFENCIALTQASTISEGVTSLNSTFYGCTELVQAPQIPSTVTSMNRTFYKCTKLNQAPEIPESVKDLSYAFYNCTELTQGPEIKEGVKNMDYTFYGCSKLASFLTIPSGVTSMNGTFYNCSSLTGELAINANPNYYNSCFRACSTNTGTNLKLTGSSNILSALLDTKSTNSNISLK